MLRFRGKRPFGTTALLPAGLFGGQIPEIQIPEIQIPDWAALEQALSTPPGLVAALLLGLLLALAAGFAWRLAVSLKAVRRGSALSARLTEALSASPDGYYLWDLVSGAETRSPRLDAILRLPAEARPGFEAVRACFEPRDAGALDAALAALHAIGAGFDLLLPVGPVAGGAARSLRIIGVRALGAVGKPLADLVWFRDISRFVAETARLIRDIERLASGRSQLQSLLDALPAPAWLRGSDLSLVFCNGAYARALEVTPDTAVSEGREIAESVIGERGRALAERARLTGVTQTESHHIVIDGKRRLLEFVEIPLAAANGGAVAMAGYAMDFTDLEKVQNDLSREIAAHGNVLEELTTAIALYGADRKIKYFNTAYLTLWRLDENWLRGGPDLGEVVEAMRERRRLPEFADFRAYKEERIRQFISLIEPHEELMHLPDGTTLRVRMIPHPFGGMLMTYDDVTDKLALERSYNTMIAVQRETLDNLYESVAVIGGDGRLKLSNPAFGRIWKLSPQQLLGEPHIADLIEATRGFYGIEDATAWAAAKDEMVAQVMARTSRSGRLERSDGSVLEYAAVPLPDGNLVLRYVEATDRYRVEQALRERNQALETASRLKSEFIANVSYELRTPLNTIIGFSEILKNEYFGKLNARQREYSDGTLEASQALLLLINDIIDLATIEAGYMALDLETVDVHAMLVSVMSLTRERARNRDLTLKFDCPPNIGTLYADQRRLRQAMFNLISNSIKFTPPGGTITVAARRHDGNVLLSVADTGVGVAKEDQERVFEKFVRGQSSVVRQSGAGLGLSLVKSFIELHGGKVEMKSASNVGTEVICYLPTQVAGVKAATAGRA
jgi:signal transduction histidine kinase